jgi:hypothetical protein
MTSLLRRFFFKDLLLSYNEILTQIKDSRHNASLTASRFRPVSQRDPAARPEYPLLAQATIHTLERNVLVYNAVAANETLYFDLVVNSNPEGGLISYHLRADPLNHMEITQMRLSKTSHTRSG